MHKHITYYTHSTFCKREFYERISSNKFLSCSPWAYAGFAKGMTQLFGGLGELHAATRLASRGVAKHFLGGSGACFPKKFFLNSAIWCVLEHIFIIFLHKNI